MGLQPLDRPEQLRVLPTVPRLMGLYGKAVLPNTTTLKRLALKALPNGSGPVIEGSSLELPAVTYAVRGARFNATELQDYQTLLGFPRTTAVPAGFTHVAAFPVAMALMVDPAFPLPLMGMVHLANRVEVARRIDASEEFDVLAWAQNLAGHNKGTSVELVTEVQVSGEIVWRGISTYLAKGKYLRGRGDVGAGVEAGAGAAAGAGAGACAGAGAGAGAEVTAGAERAAFEPPMPTALWTLGAGTGRAYASVSGDSNPIHLSAVTAKALGFPKAIAHGMYTASRALAEAGQLVGDSFLWEVEFAKPVLLPGKVSVSITQEAPDAGNEFDAESGVKFLGWNARKGSLHFSGHITNNNK